MQKEELGDLIIESKEMMYRIAVTLLKNEDDCMDAISQSIVNAFAKRDSLRKEEYARTWLIRILLNECYAVLRKRKRTIMMEQLPDSMSDRSKDYSELYEAVHQLPENMRICVELYYIEGYSIREIAKILKTTESSVKNRLLRARKSLKTELTINGGLI